MRFIRVDYVEGGRVVRVCYTGVDKRGAVQLDVLPAFGGEAWGIQLAFHARGRADGLADPDWYGNQDIAAVIARAYEQQKALAATGKALPHAGDGVTGDPACVEAAYVGETIVEMAQ